MSRCRFLWSITIVEIYSGNKAETKLMADQIKKC